MYPEYRKTMPKPIKPAPEKCERFCVCTTLADCNLNAHRAIPRRRTRSAPLNILVADMKFTTPHIDSGHVCRISASASARRRLKPAS